MTQGKSFTPGQRALALWMYDNDFSLSAIEQRVGISSSTLYSWRSARKAGTLNLPDSFEPPLDLKLAISRRLGDDTGASTVTDTPPADSASMDDAPVTKPRQQTLEVPDSDDDETTPPEPSLPVVAPLTNGGTVERAELVRLSDVLAEVDKWRQQVTELASRAARAESTLAERDAEVARLRQQLEAERETQDAAREVAGEELARERAKSEHFRMTIGYLVEVQQ